MCITALVAGGSIHEEGGRGRILLALVSRSVAGAERYIRTESLSRVITTSKFTHFDRNLPSQSLFQRLSTMHPPFAHTVRPLLTKVLSNLTSIPRLAAIMRGNMDNGTAANTHKITPLRGCHRV